MKRNRDYKAEYQRRNELAKARGYKSYGQQRYRIETGDAPAINPRRLRSQRTIDNQVRKQRILSNAGPFNDELPWPDWFGEKDLKATRIEFAQDWSDFYSRHWSTEFDAERAEDDEHYLETYMNTFVHLSYLESHHLKRSESHYEWFVNIMHYMEADTYDRRYAESIIG